MKLLLPLLFLPALLQAGSIWVEGESPTKSSVQKHNWYSDVKKEQLSGGQWLSHYGDQPGEASYDIDAEAGTYTVWARLNPVSSHPSWKLDTADAKPIDLKDVRQQQNISADGKIDHRFIGWVKLGTATLTKGKHTVAFQWKGGQSNSGGLDCFVLTTDPWAPQGLTKPGAGVTGVTTTDTPADPKDAIWVEGESPTRNTMTRHPWWYDQVKKDILSGGDWISNFDKAREGTADYDFTAVTPDRYVLWVRANPSVGAKLSYKLDAGDWQSVPFSEARGEQNIAADNKPDMRFLAWTKAGTVQLAAGKHTIVWKMHSGAEGNNHGGLDCFVFTRIPFVPAGTLKPTVAKAGTGGAPDEWFPLLADEDPLDPRSVIDLSRFIPAPAGQFGFLKPVGDQLAFEKSPRGAAVKLWGVGANVEPGRYSHEQLTQRAKVLRKFGINSVRQHAIFDELTTKGVLDPKKLDEYDWWFAELKKHGIYSDWSVFYHFTIGPDDGYPAELFAELPKQGSRGDTYGLITASPQLWEIRNRWLVQILQHKNPYTGLRYVDDPALATVEMQNEDSIFFWNPLGELANAKGKWPQHAKLLRQRFAAWVKAKYKTDEALKVAWGYWPLRNGDSVEANELALMSPWELDGPGPRGPFEGQMKRAGDFIQCMAEMQHGFYTDSEKAIRAAGFKAVTITTAWQVGGAATDAANTWTDTVGGMIDRHNYAGGGAGGHGITEGKVDNFSHLTQPGGGIFTTGMKQVEGKPFAMTEWTQSPPNQWKLECAPIMAFYGMGLQGWDASWHFMQSGTRLGDGWPGMSSYSTDTPHYLGQFPALAMAVHRGDIKEGAIVAARRLTKDDIFSGRDMLKQDATKGSHDNKTMVVTGGTPLEAFAMGRVTVGFNGGKTEQADFTKFWNVLPPPNLEHMLSRENAPHDLFSNTGELHWNYWSGHECIAVSSPRTQGVIGRTGGSSPVFCRDFSATSIKTPFVSLLFTALDDLPLATSKHILITALAQDKQSGARYSADGKTLESVGTAPLLLEPVQAKITLKGPKPLSVTPCDHYGVPLPRQVPIAPDGAFEINGTYRAYYYEVKR
jgi:hypothetical protein